MQTIISYLQLHGTGLKYFIFLNGSWKRSLLLAARVAVQQEQAQLSNAPVASSSLQEPLCTSQLQPGGEVRVTVLKHYSETKIHLAETGIKFLLLTPAMRLPPNRRLISTDFIRKPNKDYGKQQLPCSWNCSVIK